MEKLRRSRSRSTPPCSRAAEKKGFLAKAVERWRSLGRRRPPPARPAAPASGCFAVLVGPEKERFVVRAEYANHPLFRALLDEAEAEYGFQAGPLVLPCGGEEFRRVMSELELERDDEDEEEEGVAVAGSAPRSPAWRFFSKGGGHGGYLKMSPTRTSAS